jgi:hypothetical protein
MRANVEIDDDLIARGMAAAGPNIFMAIRSVRGTISSGCLLIMPPPTHGRDIVCLQDIIRFQLSGHVSARVILARVLWLQGFSDQAVRTA